MCGICGVYHRNSEQRVEKTTLIQMADSITHRGPDEEGYFINDNVGLAIRRLKIIDLETGTQPITDTTKQFSIIYNGEVYNFQELRQELIQHGYPLKTKSDTEVILYAFIHWGPECVHRLNGMFAFAIYDSKNKSLFIARDRLGIKPLFFFDSKSRFIFGSEIKAILQHPDVVPKINPRGLFSHFMMNYIPENLTLFEGIRSIPPGHHCTVTAEGHTLSQYWEIFPETDFSGNFDDAKNQFSELFNDAIRLQLNSDVPLGVFLSGGVDSSSIASVASRLNTNPIQTFSVGFDEKTFDESRYSALVSKHLGTVHHHITVKPDILDILPKIIYHMEEPTADSSAVPVYYLSEYTRRFVTVALSGDGADEIAAGYETYTADYLAKLIRWLPQSVKQLFIRFAKLFPVRHEKYSLPMKWERFFRGIQEDYAHTHFLWRAIWYPEELKFLFDDTVTDYSHLIISDYRNRFEKNAHVDLISKVLFADTTYYLPNDMLIKVDRMSMANSLEVRVPFLDHRLVEFFFQIPSKYKLNRFINKKYIIKKAMADHLPGIILKRPKAGFNAPISLWFLKELKPLMADLISDKNTKSIPFITWPYIKKIWISHQKLQADHGYKLWSVLIYILWYYQFIEKKHVTL